MLTLSFPLLAHSQSAFLDLLFRNNCIRTQKKQKVFYWYSVSHDKLFLDALERDARREKLGQEPASIAIAEPALSFRYDPTLPLLDQLKSDLGIEKVEETIFSSSAVSHQAYPLLPSSLQDNDHYRQKGEASREHLNFQRSAYSAMHAEGLPSAYTPSYHPSGPQLPSATTLHAQAGTSEAYIDMEGQLFSKPHSTADFFHAASQNNHFPAAQAVSSPISASHKAGAATCQSSPPEQEAHSTMSLRPSEARFICPWYTCGHLFACLPQLLQHIRLHTLVLPLSSQETMLKAVEATSLPSVQPESFARHNAEVSTLLDVLNSSSISSHALNSSGYTSASRSPASTYSPHPASQEATEDIPHQAFMIAPAPSIRRRSS